MNSDIKIDAAFPGGNIVVERREGADIWLHQELRDTSTDWFYWCFRVLGAMGQTLTFHFTKSRAIGVRGPAVSLDQGKTWAWLSALGAKPDSFTYSFSLDAKEVRLSFGMPYQVEQWNAFVAGLSFNTNFVQTEFCKSGQGRSIPAVRFGCLSALPRHRAVLTCRHHCCEMMASYSLEGLITFVLSDKGKKAEWLRSNVVFLALPFMDIDGVENGDQGKNRLPHDHNRDYAGESLYASVRTLRCELPAWSQGRLSAALDLHCPCIEGLYNEAIYLVGNMNPAIEEEQRRFSVLLEANVGASLSFLTSDFLPFGKDWNQGPVGSTMPFDGWAASLPGIRFAGAIEIPYANARGSEVNQTSARAFGHALARAMAVYLESV